MSKYKITELNNGNFSVSCHVPDGVHSWLNQDRNQAIASLVERAQLFNDEVITVADIAFYPEGVLSWFTESPGGVVTQSWVDARGVMVPLDGDDVGPQKYPGGLKGLLLWVAGKL